MSELATGSTLAHEVLILSAFDKLGHELKDLTALRLAQARLWRELMTTLALCGIMRDDVVDTLRWPKLAMVALVALLRPGFSLGFGLGDALVALR